MNNTYVSVSTEPFKSCEDIISYAKKIQNFADFLHCDVMDGNFVEKKTFDHSFIKNINNNSLIPLDVHLMVCEPFSSLDKYINAGANAITVHYEAFDDKNQLHKTLQYLKSRRILTGISFRPETPFKEIKPFCFDIDIVLIMAVHPGKSGQKFLTQTYSKLSTVAEFKKDNSLKFLISVDGGVCLENAKKLVQTGANILVSGSFVFNSKNQKEAILSLKKAGC